jgi:hypothetical protein
MSGARLIFAPERFPSQGIIYDRAGMPVDASGWMWRLNALSNRNRLNFALFDVAGGSVFTSIVLFLAERIKLVAPDSAFNAFEALLLLRRSRTFMEALRNDLDLDCSFFDEMRALNDIDHSRLHHVRECYRWCARRRLPHFSAVTARELEDLVIGGNEKGRAVRTRDPLHGAFDDVEFAALCTRLRAIGPQVLSRQQLALVWLALAFGRNAFAYALMREADLKPIPEAGTGRIYHRFNVPRIKKRGTFIRDGADPFMLNLEVGAVVQDLIRENGERRASAGWPPGCGFPLFARSSPQPGFLDGPMHEFAMHMTAAEITGVLKEALDKLEIVSHRTGEPLRVTTRRFRRTFATRAVEEGMSEGELAVALGHTDLQNVGVYFETRASQVERLDAALATKLGPIADAFMGRIVDGAADVVNGDDPSKRIPWFRRKFGDKPRRGSDLGTCGSGPCGLFAPVSCYTCVHFQPWRDGPHREVLDWLVEERARKQEAGLDAQIVKLHDATILAVGNVVAVCEGGRT